MGISDSAALFSALGRIHLAAYPMGSPASSRVSSLLNIWLKSITHCSIYHACLNVSTLFSASFPFGCSTHAVKCRANGCVCFLSASVKARPQEPLNFATLCNGSTSETEDFAKLSLMCAMHAKPRISKISCVIWCCTGYDGAHCVTFIGPFVRCCRCWKT